MELIKAVFFGGVTRLGEKLPSGQLFKDPGKFLWEAPRMARFWATFFLNKYNYLTFSTNEAVSKQDLL
jgi:hypothetical protein